jgi:predicted DCC family thiol-disulfide oxidoreductase YuxK
MNVVDTRLSAARSDAACTVFYDGDCPVCAREIALYERLDKDGRLALVDIARDAKPLLGTGLSQAQALGRLHVQTRDGKIVSGAEAFRALWAQLPGWRWLASLMRLPGVTPVAELFYRVFLKVRPLLIPRRKA